VIGRAKAAQLLRRGLQIGVLLFVVYAASGATWRNHKMAHNNARLVGLIHGDGWAKAYALNEEALELFGESYEASLGMLGMPWAGRIFGLDTVDPLMATSHALRTRSLSLALWAGVLLPLVVALLLGKVFCSHLCPARLVFEVGQLARKGVERLVLERLDLELPEVHSDIRIGGWVLLGGVAAAASAGTAVWLFILPYVGLCAAIFAAITGGAALGLAVPVVGWVLIDALVAPGFWCHNLCPTGWWIEKVGARSLLRLQKRGDHACPTACNLCEIACPYSLTPKHRNHRPACDNCGACVTACPSDRLGRTMKLSIGAPAVVSTDKARAEST